MATIPISSAFMQTPLPPRPDQCHKGDFGCVGVIGGAAGMAGAVLLAARAALQLGAGRVYGGVLDPRIGIDPIAPELMLTTPEAVLTLTPPGCLVIGPGLGQGTQALALLKAALKSPLPLLIDADALNLLAAHPVLMRQVAQRPPATLLTPHPGEAARLLGTTTETIQINRETAVRTLQQQSRSIVIVKGAGTLICAGDTVWQNSSGNPGLAAPGMGDVLAGMIAALIAQGANPVSAAGFGVWLHGFAADQCLAKGIGPLGLTASEVSTCARSLLNTTVSE
jgi:hydroxyethylthiazole kinase-like uncharacterized protein yjeF